MSGRPCYRWLEATGEVFAAELAWDIVATASEYPAIRAARSFTDLHEAYDVNESVLAAAVIVGVDLFGGQAALDLANAATAIVDEALCSGGWSALCDLATPSGWQAELHADLSLDLLEAAELDAATGLGVS